MSGLYGRAVDELTTEWAFTQFGSGQTDDRSRVRLKSLKVSQLFVDAVIENQPMAECCLSGLWLLHNFLDESHSISQRIKTPEGSYWHAIMHRLEGDFSNSQYWHRQAGSHPTDPSLQEFVRCEYGNHADPALKSLASQWDSQRFVDFAREHQSDRSGLHDEYRRIASQQWRCLFDFCFRAATGA